MQNTQTRSHKAKSTRSAANAGAPPAAKSKQRKAEVRPGMSAQDFQVLIAQAAYYRAEKRGFAPGFELQDWIEAEAELLRRLDNA